MYHELSERKKQKYSDKAEKAKEQYQEKMKQFMYDLISRYMLHLFNSVIYLLLFREAHPDYVLPKSKQSAKPVPPKLPTPFKLFTDAKMPGFISNKIPIAEAR